jgi:eukaryotic-like serine/threonine-protein kinase
MNHEEAETNPGRTETQPGGRRIGPYMLVREIGRGGMGSVYQAIRADGEFHQAVAIKLIKRGVCSDSILRRFRQERHILARLDHPNIARLLDAGTTDDGQPYLVMDFVDGISISAYCIANRLSTRERLELFAGVCDAVQDAHIHSVVHRDLKPANILVTKERRPKLLDFGIAKWLDPELAPETAAETLPGTRLLTPDYASPEQVRGQAVTERTDVYALGTVLFELLTETKAQPANARSMAELMIAVCDSPVRMPSMAVSSTSVRREIEGDLDKIVVKAMQKEPAQRYQSVEDLAADVRAYLGGGAVSARGKSRAYRLRMMLWRNRLVVAALSLALAALAAVGALLWERRSAEEKITSIAVLPFVNLGVQTAEDTLADGLSEDLITALALQPDLKIPGRTTVLQYKGKAIDVREAGRQLGVGAVLEGSVRRTSGQVRVVAQLISVRDGFHLWAESYDRQVTDPLLLEREISGRIADDLKVRLTGGTGWKQSGRAAPASDASKDYLEGHRLFRTDEIHANWKQGLPPRMQAAIDAFESATRKDPQFAAAWASLADASEWAIGFDESRRPQLRRDAEAAARKALALEPTNAVASGTLGLIYWFQDWDLRRAEPLLRSAVEVNPRSLTQMTYYADFLAIEGRLIEAKELLMRAQLLEPSAARLPARLAVILARNGTCGEARAAAQRALALAPNTRNAQWALALCDDYESNLVGAETGFRALAKLGAGESRSQAGLGHVLARAGHPARIAEARRILSSLLALGDKSRRFEVLAALVHTGLGERTAAAALLDEAWTKRDPLLLSLMMDWRFKPLAGEPRFDALMARLAALR